MTVAGAVEFRIVRYSVHLSEEFCTTSSLLVKEVNNRVAFFQR